MKSISAKYIIVLKDLLSFSEYVKSERVDIFGISKRILKDCLNEKGAL